MLRNVVISTYRSKGDTSHLILLVITSGEIELARARFPKVDCTTAFFDDRTNCNDHTLSIDQHDSFTTVSNSTRPAMSKTSLDFGIFCSEKSALSRPHILIADLLGNKSKEGMVRDL